ncbi:MAG: hypothetical protein OXC79_00680, partial [Candidatus Poribacteria bacterium]|nr:hypothetical protein [Candidatus Poribacteria bacterium]
LPEKVKDYIAKKKEAAASEGQTIWYECVDNPTFWAKGGHKSYKQEGAIPVDDVLTDTENQDALMVSYKDNRLFTIHQGAMFPA